VRSLVGKLVVSWLENVSYSFLGVCLRLRYVLYRRSLDNLPRSSWLPIILLAEYIADMFINFLSSSL
jgi:hypothetical protein